jgi:hypothetical protein
MILIQVLTDFGDLAVLLPLAAVVTLWSLAVRQPIAVFGWLVALGLCISGTAVLKIYFFIFPPVTDLHSPSGHTSLSTLVYGALTLAVAAAFTGWRRWRLPARARPLSLVSAFRACLSRRTAFPKSCSDRSSVSLRSRSSLISIVSTALPAIGCSRWSLPVRF